MKTPDERIWVVARICRPVGRLSVIRLHDHSLDHAWLNLGVGFAAFLAIPLLMVLLMIPILTMPLAVIIGIIYGVSLFFSPLLAALVLGMLILGRYRGAAAASTWYGALAIGLLLIGLLTWIPVIGTIAIFLILFFGLGSILSYMWNAYRREVE